MSITLIALVVLTLGTLFLLDKLIDVLVRGEGSSRHVLSEDLPGWRSTLTFKPLPRFYDRAMAPQHPYRSAMMLELCERLRQRGAKIEKIVDVADAERAHVSFDGQLWELTLGRYQTHPEQWLLTTDMLLGRRKQRSAPHDTTSSRAMFTLLKTVLEGMDVSTMRWHARQSWNAGKTDSWAYKPF